MLGSAMLLVALPMRVIVRGTEWPDARRAWGSALIAITLLTSILVSHSTEIGRTPWRPLFELAPHALLMALLVNGGVAVASTVLAAALLLVVVLTKQAGAPWATGAPVAADVQLHVAAVAVSLLALLLIAHASRASALWRENRREWALDGSRLGVADWHLHNPKDAFVSATWRRLAGDGAERLIS